MVLTVITMLMLAVMMVIGFNVAHTVHERMRIQQAADAQAYTVAVLQARALNVNAVLNRTIAALTVAQMSLHAWNTIATHEVDMLNAGFMSFLQVSAYEAGVAKCSKWTPHHCIDAAQAAMIAMQYSSEKSDYEQKLQGKEQDFNDAVKALYEAKKDLFEQQKGLVGQVRQEINGGSILRNMLRKTAPRASYISAFHNINQGNLDCALDGPDDQCSGSEPLVFERSSQSAEERSKTMENSANAARARFHRSDMMVGGATLDHSDFRGNSPISVRNPSKMMDIQSEGSFDANYMPGAFASRVGDSEYSSSSDNGETAKNVGSESGMGFVRVRWRHGHGGWMLGSAVFSSENGGEHRGAVGDQHSEFKGIGLDASNANFITFRGHTSPSASNEFGQPSGYGGVTQNLRLLQTDTSNRGGAYEIAKDGSGTITLKIGNQQHRVTLVPKTNGIAVGKAKAYFHQLGADWKLPPNGFDPFWRAKLHPFRNREELQAALNLAGDPSANVQGPVEGKEQ